LKEFDVDSIRDENLYNYEFRFFPENKIFEQDPQPIEKLETLVISFYDNHGQYLKKWIPKAPSPLKEDLNIDE